MHDITRVVRGYKYIISYFFNQKEGENNGIE